MSRTISKVTTPQWWRRSAAGASEAAKRIRALLLAILLAPGTALALPTAPADDNCQPNIVMKTALPDGHIATMMVKLTGERPLLALPVGNTDTSWVDEMYMLIASEELEGAIGLLYDNIDDMLLEERMQECDRILQMLDLSKMESYLMIGVLSITLSAANKLPSRPALVTRIENVLQQTHPDDVNDLLRGLR